MEFADLEASSRITLDDGTVLTRCDQCRTMYAERTPPGTPPCDKCFVELMEENRDAAMVYMAVRGQVITRGMDGVVTDINHLAVDAAIERNGITDRRRVFNQVVSTFHHFLKEQREKD